MWKYTPKTYQEIWLKKVLMYTLQGTNWHLSKREMVPIIDSKCGLVGDTVIVPRRVVLLMVQKSGEKTTWDVYNLVNNWIWTTNLNRWSSRFLVAINSMYSFWRIKALQVGIQEYVCVYIFFYFFSATHWPIWFSIYQVFAMHVYCIVICWLGGLYPIFCQASTHPTMWS